MLGLLVTALLFSADAGAASHKPRFFVPEVISTVDIPGEQRALGVPMKLLAVRSRLPPDEVRLSLMKQFRDAGLYIPPAAHQTLHETTIVGLEPASLTAYSAVLRPNRDGTTTVVLGTSYLARSAPQPLPDWGPVYPGASAVVTSDVELMQTALYTVSASETDVRAFYDAVMAGAGYKRTGPGSYLRGSERITVTMGTEEQQTRVMMVRQRGVSDEQ